MTHFLKGRKQSPEHIARRTAAVKEAMQRPEVKAKMTGRPTSKETRAKIGAANSKKLKGRKLSVEVRANMSKARKLQWEKRKADKEFMEQWSAKLSKALKGKYLGEEASGWKGGKNQDERMGLKHEAWKTAVLSRDNYTCQICEEVGVFLHADHIKRWSKYPELRFEVSNGRALCRPCHYYVTFKRKMPKGSRWAVSRKLA